VVYTGKGFDVILASPPEYERLIGEIYCDGNFVAIVSQERGEGEFDLEFPGTDVQTNSTQRKVDARGFQDAITLACRRLNGEVP